MAYPKVAGESVRFRENFLNRASVVANGGMDISANVSSISNGMTTTGGGVDYNFPEMDWFWETGGSIVLKLQVEDGADAGYRRFFVYRIDDNFSIDLTRRQTSNEFLTSIQTGPGNTQYGVQYSGITEGTPFYLTLTWDPATTTWTVYEDTTLKGTDSISGATSITLDSTSRTLRLGQGSVASFAGQMFSATVYSKVLSLPEITDIVNEDTFEEVDASKALMWLPCDAHYLDSTQKTENLGSLGGTVQVGDGSTSGTFPTVKPTGFEYDNSNDYLHYDNAGIDNMWATGGSLSFWMQPYSDGEDNFGKVFDKAHAVGWVLQVQDEASSHLNLKLNVKFDGGAGAGWTTSSRPVSLNQWNHVVIVYNGSNVDNNPIFYINGVALIVGGGITETLPPVGTIEPDNGVMSVLEIGSDFGGGSSTFDGVINKPAVWSSELTETQAKYLYNKGRRQLGQ